MQLTQYYSIPSLEFSVGRLRVRVEHRNYEEVAGDPWNTTNLPFLNDFENLPKKMGHEIQLLPSLIYCVRQRKKEEGGGDSVENQNS